MNHEGGALLSPTTFPVTTNEMKPSPTFLESLKPHERFELLQRAHGDTVLGAISGPLHSGTASRCGNGMNQASSVARGRRLPQKGQPHAHVKKHHGVSGSAKVHVPEPVALKNQRICAARRHDRHGQESEDVHTLESSRLGVLLEQGSIDRKQVTVMPSASQGCAKELEEWAETLSRDNTALASEVMQLRAMLAAEKENGHALGDRVGKLQDLFVESFSDEDSLHCTRQSVLNAKLEALATPEVLAITRPPATFPVPVPHEHQSSNPEVLLDLEKLRRQLVSAQTSLARTEKDRDSLAEQLESCQAKRKAEKAAYQKQAAELSAKMLGAMRRLVYAADQISKKDESIKSLSSYIHRLEQQALLLRKSSNKRGAKVVRRCHSHDADTARTQAQSQGSPLSTSHMREDLAGSQLQHLDSCMSEHKPSAPLSGAHMDERNPDANIDLPHCVTRYNAGEPSSNAAPMSGSLRFRAQNVPAMCDGAVHEQRLNCSKQGSAAQSELQELLTESPDSDSYASQLLHATDALDKSRYGVVAQRSRHEQPGLSTVSEAESSYHERRSTCADSAPCTASDLCDQPSIDMFGGTFGTRPDFDAGTQVRSTADSETWKTYMAAIDEIEQRISALDFPADVDSTLLNT